MLSFDAFAKRWKMDPAPLGPVVERYPFALNSYFEGLIAKAARSEEQETGRKTAREPASRFPLHSIHDSRVARTILRNATGSLPSAGPKVTSHCPGDAVWKQVVPDTREISDPSGFEDPLAEESLSPVPNLVHRYPNRILWLVSDQCAVHCRFCTRKRKWKHDATTASGNAPALGPALDYIARHEQIQDVLLSGGDPFLLPREHLREILIKLREIRHVQIIRIGSRVPCALPSMITGDLADMLSQFHPLLVNIHFNHPVEITAESQRACAVLANAGIPLGSQTVLLRGINDSEAVLAELFHRLLCIRVRPYYLMQMDLTSGTAHFRTPIGAGLRILRKLRNRISGPAMPHFVVDLPGGRGKTALLPNMIREIGSARMIVQNYLGELCSYPLLEGEEESLRTELRTED